MSRTHLSRRTILKGLGTTMSLPMLEAMLPGPGVISSAAAAESPAAPVRMAFVFFPNGAIMEDWNCQGEGEDYQLSKTLEPLADYKKDITVFSGLAQHHGRANGDGAGDHARNAGVFLTGCQPRKTAGANIEVGQSVDQAVASVIGKQTKLPSLELGVDRSRNAGSCDSGYSCAYSSNISWKTPNTPMAKEINPRLAFERLFGTGEDFKSRARRDLYRQSILDLVSEDAKKLKNRLGLSDRRKIDEYFSSVRELELRIESSAVSSAEVPEYDLPEGIPKETQQHIRLMYDIMALGFQTNTTRVATFMLANAGSNRTYPNVGVTDGHHNLSHHRLDKEKIKKISKVDRFLVSEFAYFLGKLKSIKEGEGNLLDNSMILYGSAISDGNRHQHHDLPILLAGRGGGTIQSGRHLVYEKDTPLNNLYLALLHRMGVEKNEFGDSQGPLRNLKT